MVLVMSFLSLSNTEVQFDAEKLTWRTYTIAEALSTTSQVELIDKKEFAKIALDVNLKTCTMHISALKATKRPTIHLSRAV